jgi:hypothetical protein
MIDWYVEISEYCPNNKFKTDDYLKSVIETSTPVMNYFCKRLSELEEWTIDDANKIFSSIIDEMPIMNAKVYNGEFSIEYNKWTKIKLTETSKQIYRGIKLEKLLS